MQLCADVARDVACLLPPAALAALRVTNKEWRDLASEAVSALQPKHGLMPLEDWHRR